MAESKGWKPPSVDAVCGVFGVHGLHWLPGEVVEKGGGFMGGRSRGLVEVVSDVIVQVDLYGRGDASFAEM
jgi:hypothetical protein